MPTYEYQCGACGHRVDAFQKMSDAPLTTCPACHKEALQKLISAAGFQLKGTGWYVTDYSKKAKSNASAETKDDSSSGASTTDTKSSDVGGSENNSSNNTGT